MEIVIAFVVGMAAGAAGVYFLRKPIEDKLKK